MTFLPGDRRAALREELAPYIGERVVSLLERVIAHPDEEGDTPDVTEAEHLLLDWAKASVRGETLDGESAIRFERTFSPPLRELLVAFVAA